MPLFNQKAPDARHEIRGAALFRDVRSLGERMSALVLDPMWSGAIMMFAVGGAIMFPAIADLAILVLIGFFLWARKVVRNEPLPVRVPASYGGVDPSEENHRGKYGKADGIIFLGNEQGTNREVWITNSDARTHLLVFGTTGAGKAQPLDAKVHTPRGWVRMGAIRVGDLVSTPDGGSAAVAGVFPQGEIPIYRVTFADGRSTEACGEHLWEIHHKHWNGKYRQDVSRAGAAKPRILTTTELQAQLARNNGKFSIRLPRPVEKPHATLPLDPYLLGALLGDGSMTERALRFATADAQILCQVSAVLPQGVGLKQYPYERDCDYWFTWDGPKGRREGGAYHASPLRRALESVGLIGKRSQNKFIPHVYREASVEQRFQLLRGLMDTDGTIGRHKDVSFCSVSERLANDVRDLVHSLGGIARISTKTPHYTYKGERRQGQLAYIVHIRHPQPEMLFSLQRKRDIAKEYQYADSLKLPVSKIELVGEKKAQCILIDHPEHLYITDDYVVTHNTEALISLVTNALVQSSGFIYIDGKADSTLFGKMYSLCRMFGREDDLLVVNFMTGARDIRGPQEDMLSNTLNPFSNGSSGMLQQLIVSLISENSGKGGDMWQGRAISFVEGLVKPLVYLRDEHQMPLDAQVMSKYFDLSELEKLVYEMPVQYPGLDDVMGGLKNYFMTLPGYDKQKSPSYQSVYGPRGPRYQPGAASDAKPKPANGQSAETLEQHGFITMQLTRVFNSVSETYGHIMKTPLGEVDFHDVIVNRRILVVLLPALEKSMPELANLGKIIVASIKAMMASGLGSKIEGRWKEVIDSRPTNAPTPFMCVMDEYGYYAVQGFEVVAAQARGLGFSAIFAGQDVPSFQKAGKESAESIFANTKFKLCGALEDAKETADLFNKVAGEAHVTRVGGFARDLDSLTPSVIANKEISIERVSRIANQDLQRQTEGEFHILWRGKVVRSRVFYANPPKVEYIRPNHFLPVAAPNMEEIATLDAARRTVDKLLRGEVSFRDLAAGSMPSVDIARRVFGALNSGDRLETAAVAVVEYDRAASQDEAAFKVGLSTTEASDDFPDDDMQAIEAQHGVLPRASGMGGTPEQLARMMSSESLLGDDAEIERIDAPEAVNIFSSTDAKAFARGVVDGNSSQTSAFDRAAAGLLAENNSLTLDREETVAGLEQISVVHGVEPQEARASAEAVADEMEDASTYPRHQQKPKSEESFARGLSSLDDFLADQKGKKG